jgi:Protein of unknown function (DUF2510)
MDLGSLDFGTWRLVGLGLLSLGAIATVVAIVAIVALFRSGETDRGPAYARPPRVEHEDENDDVDDPDDPGGDDDDIEDDEHDASALDRERTEVAASARADGPTSLPLALGSPKDDLFAVPASAAPRQPIPSTRDEAHVPSPDWYGYEDDAEANPAVEPDGDDANTTFGATPQEGQRATPPASPPPATGPQQAIAPLGREPIRRSRWFEDSAATDEASTAASGPQSDPRAAVTAASPVKFPWEQRAEAESATPERPVVPAREEPVRPTADREDERRPPADPAESEPRATSRPWEQRPTGPTAPERQERQRPTAGSDDTGRAEAVPSATPAKAAERRDPDVPTADWYEDPDGSGGERWWDGKGWTRHRRRRPGSAATTDTGQQRAVGAGPQADPPAAAIRRRAAPTAESGDARGDQTSSRPPGWYRDPSGAGGRRFWDGSRWTEDG